ncbi:MAG TPA: tetratricopeptide repeat protein [Pyrinomonadaceae bacterium]
MRRVYEFVFVGLIVIASSLTALAQNSREGRLDGQPLAGQIIGQVRYADGSKPAFDVLVSCEAYSGGIMGQERTDRSGRFRFDKLGPSQFTVSVKAPGYIPVQETVELATTTTAYVQFTLRPDPNAIGVTTQPGVVTADVPAAAQKEFDKGEAALALGTKEGLVEAAKHYEQAVTIHPKFLQAQLKLGTTYMDLGQWDKAEQILHKTIEIEPKTVNALFALGEIYLRQKKDDEAEKVLLQGLALEERSYQGHLTLARVYWDMGMKLKEEAQWRPLLEKAYTHVNESLKLNPNLAQAHLVKGNLYLKVGRAPDAVTEFEEYLRLDPKGPFAEQTRATTEKIKKALASTKP